MRSDFAWQDVREEIQNNSSLRNPLLDIYHFGWLMKISGTRSTGDIDLKWKLDPRFEQRHCVL